MTETGFQIAQIERHPWGSMTWLAQGESLGVTMACLEIFPGHRTELHAHQTCAEIVHAVQGDVTCEVDGDRYTLKCRDTLIIAKGAAHRISNCADHNAKLMITYTSGARDYQTIMDTNHDG